MSELIIVTGAGRGIGKAIALAFGAGKHEVLCMSKSDTGRQTCKEIRDKGGSAAFIEADLHNYQAVEDTVSCFLRDRGESKIAVIAAAAQLGPGGPLTASSLAEWDDTMRVNLLGNLAVVKAALPMMQRRKYGRILALGGGGSAHANPTFPAYACSKAAMVREMENLAEDLKEYPDIVATCVAPGAVETDMLAQVRGAGGEVRTTTDLSEIVEFALAFVDQCPHALSGRFVHVRDRWQPHLQADGTDKPLSKDHWKLRRIE